MKNNKETVDHRASNMRRILSKMLQRFVKVQRRWCEAVEKRLIPPALRLDGARCFIDSYARALIKEGTVLYDVGGGKHPFLSVEEKKSLRIKVHGLDIDAQELASAPAESYDDTTCTDICGYVGKADADLVICQAVLEHVPNTEAAMGSIASVLKPGAAAALFVPCRNAWYARLNLLLPQQWKRRLLFAIYPDTKTKQGFPAYYDRCTPAEFIRLAEQSGLEVENVSTYYKSCYFYFLFPLYAMWRLWVMLSRIVLGQQACESFSMVLRKGNA
jgi:2-polyprenyl-3-methyl-5-hydroxy-6-metoxy-1,4-benzoquinol methylase